MRDRTVVAVAAVCVFVLASCATHSAPTPKASVPGPDEPQMNWDAPMAVGTRTANPQSSAISNAVSHFPLPLRIPADLGSPVAMQVWAPATGAPPGQAGFALVYQLGGNPSISSKAHPACRPPSSMPTCIPWWISGNRCRTFCTGRSRGSISATGRKRSSPRVKTATTGPSCSSIQTRLKSPSRGQA